MFVHVLVQTDAPLAQPLTYRAPDGMALAVGDSRRRPARRAAECRVHRRPGRRCPPGLEAKIRPVAARVENGALFDNTAARTGALGGIADTVRPARCRAADRARSPDIADPHDDPFVRGLGRGTGRHALRRPKGSGDGSGLAGRRGGAGPACQKSGAAQKWARRWPNCAKKGSCGKNAP